jgi:hypothetical protein
MICLEAAVPSHLDEPDQTALGARFVSGMLLSLHGDLARPGSCVQPAASSSLFRPQGEMQGRLGLWLDQALMEVRVLLVKLSLSSALSLFL